MEQGKAPCPKHEWTEWEHFCEQSDSEVRTCKRCGKRQVYDPWAEA